MKSFSIKILSLMLVLVLWSCGNKSGEHEHNHNHEAADEVAASGNQELYNEVMKIHDEVMPKMDDIVSLKRKLKERLDKEQDLSQVERVQIDAMIAKLDSAGDGMMAWMREFRPLPDSLGEEKAREYLENEMERVKRVRDNIYTALEQASKQ